MNKFLQCKFIASFFLDACLIQSFLGTSRTVSFNVRCDADDSFQDT